MYDLNLIYPYYKNPMMLMEQVRLWGTWPRELRERTRIVVVDDGSPDDQCANIIGPNMRHLPKIELYKVLKDIPWNQNGARNLAMKAVEGWCLITDMDHIVPWSMAGRIMDMPKDERVVYRPARRQVRDMLNEEYKRHPNSWIMTAERYWRAGGMDEDFAGWYGSDSTFRKAILLDGPIKEIDEFLVVYDEQDIDDANTRDFGRKHSEYYSVLNPKLQKKRNSPGYKAENPIRFPWRRLL